MGTINERNCKDLIEAERSRRDDKKTKENYTKKDLPDLDNLDAVVTHLEPDILEWQV